MGFSWQWFSLGGFILFAAFVYWGWFSEYRRRQQLEDMQPAVQVTPKYERSEAWLVLKNLGEHEASFRVNVLRLGAEGLTLETKQHLPQFFAKWRFQRDSPDNRLMSGASEEIAIAKTEGQHPDKTEGLNIFSAYETFSVEVPLAATIELDIEVLAEPKLKRPYRRTYVMHFDKDGNWDKFEEEK